MPEWGPKFGAGRQLDADRHLASSELMYRATPYAQQLSKEPRAIRERLEAIREAGYAHSEEEYFLGDISTAAAILDSNGRATGAINVAVAKPRWKGKADESRISDLVITAAAAISGRR
jgi:IclR family transcriptional regulator, pca regulon regulatory protein